MLPGLPDAPARIVSAKLSLALDRVVPGDTTKGLVPYYHYRILLPDMSDAGHLNFRVGDTSHVMEVAGHIGFEIEPPFRGQSLSYNACLLIAPFIKTIYPAIILTANPENGPSLRIIEKLGAVFINEVNVPENDPHYANGSRVKRRYRWMVNPYE